jgi:hypothetical protein
MINNQQGGSPGYMYNNNGMYGDPNQAPLQMGMQQGYNQGMGGMGMGQPMMTNPLANNPLTGGMTGMDPMYMSVQQIFSTISTGIFMKQKFQMLEAVTGCTVPHAYFVYEEMAQGGAKKKPIFRCTEDSSWCVRNCMSPACKPFQMKISKIFNNQEVDNNDTVILMNRECRCTICCCNRPTLTVALTENGQNIPLGKVEDNWNLCDYSFTVYDAQDQKRFLIKASSCQCGFWCKCPCDPCQKIEFNVWSGQDENPEAPILRLGSGSCVKNAISTTGDQFSCPFPKSANWQDKCLLLASILMIDFMMFEKKHNEETVGVGANQGGI